MKIEMELSEKSNEKRVIELPSQSISAILPYEKSSNRMSLADRDRYLMNIEKQIEERKLLLLDKRRHLKKVLNQNRFLTEVMGDYDKYYHVIIGQKQEQMRALQMLDRYIQGLMEKENLTAENLKDAKKEQKKILEEVNRIKKDLDALLQK